MKQKKNIQCILCPYKYDENCLDDYKVCYTLSNLYYGKIVNLFPFNLIYKAIMKHNRNKIKQMKVKYGDLNKENDRYKFIWGIKSNVLFNNHQEAGLETINDFNIIYCKRNKKYLMTLDRSIKFKNQRDEFKHLGKILDEFKMYMIKNKLDTSLTITSLRDNLIINSKFNSVEECYHFLHRQIVDYWFDVYCFKEEKEKIK